MYVMNEQDFIW